MCWRMEELVMRNFDFGVFGGEHVGSGNAMVLMIIKGTEMGEKNEGQTGKI